MHTHKATTILKGRILAITGGCLALGVAIALAQSDTEKKEKDAAAPKAPSAARKDATDSGQRGARPDANAPARKRSHGLGFEAEAKDQGIRVTGVDDKGIAAQAGLRTGDRIVSVGGRQFTRTRPMQAFLAGQGGQRIPVIIERDGQQYTVQFTPGQLQDDSAWLGVYLDEGDADTKGARVTQVYPAGPAARAGLWVGDVVTNVGGQKIDDSADLVATVQGLEPEQRVEFAVLRGDQEVKVPVVLGRRDSFMYRDFDQGPQDGQQPQDDTQQRTRHDNNQFDNVPPYAMQLEHDRRNDEQHERIENEIRLLREEIAKLREELKKK